MLTLMSSCADSSRVSPVASDSYCQSYQKIIREKGDGKMTASPGVKRRVAANEITYRCLCEGLVDPLCK